MEVALLLREELRIDVSPRDEDSEETTRDEFDEERRERPLSVEDCLFWRGTEGARPGLNSRMRRDEIPVRLPELLPLSRLEERRDIDPSRPLKDRSEDGERNVLRS